jgi:hypothetical protein
MSSDRHEEQFSEIGDAMPTKRTVWIHAASFTYRLDEPDRLLETLWCERPGWGYLKRRDLWVKREADLGELRAAGFHPRRPESDEDVHICPFCGVYMSSIPGSLVNKHKAECGGFGEDWMALEDALISDVRMKRYEERIAEDTRREQEELVEEERRERQDRIKEGLLIRQLQKDRKRRLKEETKEEWKRR